MASGGGAARLSIGAQGAPPAAEGVERLDTLAALYDWARQAAG